MARKKNHQENECLTVSQLCERAGVASKFVRDAINSRELPAYDLGVTRIYWSDWEHFRAKKLVKKKRAG